MSRPLPIAFGALLLAGAGAAALVPIDDEFSDFGLGLSGVVTVECGNAFSSDGDVNVRGEPIGVYEPIFINDDGRTVSAAEYCRGEREGYTAVAGIAGVVGLVVVLFGLFAPTRSAQVAAPRPPPLRSQPPPPGRQPPPPHSQSPSPGQPPAPTSAPGAAAATPDEPMPPVVDGWWTGGADPVAPPTTGVAPSEQPERAQPSTGAPAAPMPDPTTIESLPDDDVPWYRS